MEKESNQEEDNNQIGLANGDWDKIVETLKLLSRPGVKIINIAEQVERSEKWVRDKRKEASNWPAALVATLPPEVQAYLVGRSPNLKSEIEEFRRSLSSIAHSETSAIETAKAKHWDDLSSMAKQFEDLWNNYLASSSIIREGYIVDIDSGWFEAFTVTNNDMAKWLLSHLKAEFSTEFQSIDDWRDLLKEPLPPKCLQRLRMVANRRTFKGTCDICQGWS